jgi:hypothetical protein
VQFGQRLLQGAAADPAARGGEVRPAQALGRLSAEEYIESAAQRIRVDQERAQPSRAEVTASAQASVEAPAPPRPPITPTVRAGRPTPSATSAIRSTSHCSPSGSIRTWSAPISTARRQTPESSWSRPTSTTPRLRAAPAHPPRGVVADEDQRRRLPAAAALRHPVVDLGPGAGRGAQPQQVVQQIRVLRDDQRSALPPSAADSGRV